MKTNITIQVDQLNETLDGILKEYDAAIVAGLKKNTKRAMKDLVSNTKATAPVGRRQNHFRDNITSRKLSDTHDGLIMQWYVKGSDYRLTHLLEHGHMLRDGGRYPGTQFIGKTLNAIIPWYLSAIEEVIKNG